MSNVRSAIRLATIFRTVKVTGDWKLALHIGGMTMIEANEWCVENYGVGAYIVYRRLHRGAFIENLKVSRILFATGFKDDAEFKAWAKVQAAKHHKPVDSLQPYIFQTLDGKYLCFIGKKFENIDLVPFDGNYDGLSSAGMATEHPKWIITEFNRIWQRDIDMILNNAFRDIRKG